MRIIIFAVFFMGMVVNISNAQTALVIKLENRNDVNRGTQIPINGVINIPSNGNLRVGFSINNVKPYPLVTEGYLKLYLKTSSNSEPINIYNAGYFTSCSWSSSDPSYFSTSTDITLNTYYFNLSRGILYVEFPKNNNCRLV